MAVVSIIHQGYSIQGIYITLFVRWPLTIAFAPVAIPAIISTASTFATNYATGQAVSFATGLVADAAHGLNPQLGQAVEILEKGVRVYNAVTSLGSDLGAVGTSLQSLHSVGDVVNALPSLASFDTAHAVSAITGNASFLANTAGVNVPGLDKMAEYAGYVSAAGQATGTFMEAKANIEHRQMWAALGNKYAYAGDHYAKSASDHWAEKSLSKDPLEAIQGNIGLGFTSLVSNDEAALSTALTIVPIPGVSYIAGKVIERVGGKIVGQQVANVAKIAKEGFDDLAGQVKRAGNYRPNRPLPRDPKTGKPIPDVNAPHTQLGVRQGRKDTYTQGREWALDKNGKPIPKRDVDFTDHGRPQNHSKPHQHDFEPNPTGGTPKHGDAREMEWP